MTTPKPPERQWTANGAVPLSVLEWGPVDGPPLLLIHGGGDFARSFDGFAPWLAAAGWRVAAWDQRGHGNSGHADLYSYGADIRDAAAVATAFGVGEPVTVVGHSKGGLIAIELAVAQPDLVRACVAIDGFVRRTHWEGSPASFATQWLDLRHRKGPLRASSIEELAERRQKANPRVGMPWCRYLAEIGSAPIAEEPGKRRWTLDPMTFPPSPHGWTASLSFDVLRQVQVPLLALKAAIAEPMAGQPATEALRVALPPSAEYVVLEGLGHFAHIEDPESVAKLTLSFLARHGIAPT